jgi:hypothetical protein
MKRERRTLTKGELEKITSRRPVLRRIPHSPTPNEYAHKDDRRRQSLTLTHEDRAYLKACQALGISPATGEKNGHRENGNGLVDAAANTARARAREDLAPHGRERANYDEWCYKETARQRRQHQQRENVTAWCDWYLKLAHACEERARMHREKHARARKLLAQLEGARG